MRVQKAFLGLAAIGFVAMLVMPWGAHDDQAVLDAVTGLGGQWVDRPAPQFELLDRGGQRRALSDYRGQVVFLNFWASFCEPCRREMPSMENLVRQYSAEGMVMLAVSMDTDAADADRFMEEFLPGQRSAMTILLDPSGDVGKSYGTEKIPETYIIDRSGRVVARFVGEYDWTRPQVKQIIEALL
ncbi:MAG: TlpA family protein disulfide reductase [Bradymonadaceae bacterium]|nr:TlpA family protein disulfide reductase [Lujinxingiaceae bacterium]